MIFRSLKTIRSFEREIYNIDLSLDDELELQRRLKYDIDIFKESINSEESVKRKNKVQTPWNAAIFLNGSQRVLNVFESEVFPKEKQAKGLRSILEGVASGRVTLVAKVSAGNQLKILTAKQIIERLPLAFAQVKAGNTSKKLAN